MSALHEACRGYGGAAPMAARLGVTPPAVYQWLKGRRPIPVGHVVDIDRDSAGKYRAEALRPDVHWVRVPDPAWPHPEGRPCIDVARPVEARAASHDAACDPAQAG